MGLRRLWRSRARPTADVGTPSDIYSLASDETCRGGYLITEVPDSPVIFLTVPLPKNGRDGTGAWRHLFRTLGTVTHPAGTWVRRVSVERVFDWARWEAAQRAEPSDPGPPDTAGTETRPPGHPDLT